MFQNYIQTTQSGVNQLHFTAQAIRQNCTFGLEINLLEMAIKHLNSKIGHTIFIILLFSASVLAQKDTTSNLTFDFGITRGKNINIWPLFKKYRDSQKNEMQIIYPFYARSTQFSPRDKHLQIVPFLILDSNALEINKKYLSLYYPSLYRYSKSTTDSSYIKRYKFIELAPYITLFGVSKSPDGTFVENNAFFFIWYKRNALNQESRLTVFPLYWYHTNKYETSHYLVPLYYQKKSAGRTKINIALLYNFKRTDDFSKVSLFPIFWHRSSYFSCDTAQKNTLFPIYWSNTSKDTRSRVLFPLIYSFKKSSFKSFTFFPLYSYSKLAACDMSCTAITPIYWHIKDNSSNTTIICPLFLASKRYLPHDTIYTKMIIPIYWSQQSKWKSNNVLFPVVFSSRDTLHRSFTLFPFYSSGKRSDSSLNYTAITPLYWDIRTYTNHRNVLFPVYWSNVQYSLNDTLTNKALFPLYWSSKNSVKNNRLFLPFVFSLRDTSYQSLTVLPIFSCGHSQDNINRHFDILPFYWHNKGANSYSDVVFPLWWSFNNFSSADTLRRKALVPIYWSSRSNRVQSDVVFPIIYKFSNAQKSSMTIFPIYSQGASADKSFKYRAITPMFWKVVDHDKSKKVLFPIYWSTQGKGVRNAVLFPFYYNLKDSSNQSLTVFPFFSKGLLDDGTKKYFELLQIYWSVKSKENNLKVILPFWLRNTKFHVHDTIETRIFFPLYLGAKNKYRTSDFFIPFYFHGTTSDSTRKFTGITPIFWHWKYYSETYNLLFPICWTKKDISRQDTLMRFTLFPIIWTKKEASSKTNNKILFPLIFSLKNNQNQSFTLFPLYLNGHNSDNSDRYSLITPLGGYFKNSSFTRTYFFPIFHVKKEANKTKSSILWYLYRKTKTPTSSQISILWPICERLVNDTIKSFRVAPIIWYSKTDSSRMSTVQPFYYSFKSITRNTFILSWFLYKHESYNGISTSNSILWRFYYQDKYLNGDYETRFLHVLYANVKKNGKRELSLYPFYHRSYQSNGDYSKSIFFGFYNSFSQYIPEIKESYKEDRVFWFMRLRSNYEKLKRDGKEKFLRRK